MSSGTFGKNESESSTQVDIPDFLRPFLNQATGTASGALSRLGSSAGQDLVADLNPDQIAAMQLARERAGGSGGFIPTTQQELLRTAQGVDVSSFLPNFDALSGFGGGVNSFLPPETLAALRGATGSNVPTQATDALGNAISANVIPGVSRSTLASGATGSGIPADARATLANAGGSIPQSTIDRLSGLPDINQTSRDALTGTARGDFLFGGEGFDAAVNAAVRAAQPHILSTFGSAGAGGATGGLARHAIGQSAIDAFASQFGQERGRQLSAADSLAGLDLSRNAQDINAATSLGNLGLSDSAQRLGAANSLAGFGLSDRGQQFDAANILASLGLSENAQRLGAANSLGALGLDNARTAINAGGLLGNFASDDRNRQLQAGGLLAGLSDAERNRQLQAVGLLPDAGLLDVNLLQQIGGQQQTQEQRELEAPFNAQLRLLQAALGGLPISSLLGQSSQGTNTGFQFGWEA